MNSLQLLGDIIIYSSHYLIEKDKLIFSKIMDLFFKIIKELNRFEFLNDNNIHHSQQEDLMANMINNNFGTSNQISINKKNNKKEKKIMHKNYIKYQNIFNTIIENLMSMFLGVKNISEKGSVYYNYIEDPAFLNFSKRFFSLIKSCFEKYSKYINSGHNYDLMENVLNLFSDYSILFGFKYNLKNMQVRSFSDKALLIHFREEEFLYDIIELLRNSYLSKYSESLKYAYRNAIEI